jgi:hypothetical protein
MGIAQGIEHSRHGPLKKRFRVYLVHIVLLNKVKHILHDRGIGTGGTALGSLNGILAALGFRLGDRGCNKNETQQKTGKYPRKGIKFLHTIYYSVKFDGRLSIAPIQNQNFGTALIEFFRR